MYDPEKYWYKGSVVQRKKENNSFKIWLCCFCMITLKQSIQTSGIASKIKSHQSDSKYYNNMGKGQRTFKCDQHHSHSTAKARLRCMRSRGVDPFKSKSKKKLGDKFRSIIRKTINSYRYICNIEKSPHFTHFFDQKQIKTLLIHWFISTLYPYISLKLITLTKQMAFLPSLKKLQINSASPMLEAKTNE